MILVAESESSTVAIYYLDAAAEIEGEVETRRARHGNAFIEIEETSCSLGKRLYAPIATEVELQTYGRSTPAVDTLTSLIDDETRTRRHQREPVIRQNRQRHGVDCPFKRDAFTRGEHAPVSQPKIAKPGIGRFAN